MEIPTELVFAGVFVLWLVGCWLFEEPTDQPRNPSPTIADDIPGWESMSHDEKVEALNEYWSD